MLLTRRQLIGLAVATGLLGAGAILVARNRANEDNELPGAPIEPNVTMESAEIGAETDLAATGSWHQAGLTHTTQGLELQPTGLSIVNKRAGDRIEPNPPLNVYGTRLQAEGNFAVRADIESGSPVSLQLYGQVPLRFDDFRFERGRLEYVMDEQSCTVRVWDGSQQAPSIQQSMPLDGSVTRRSLEVQRRGSDVVLLSNEAEIGRVPAGHIFNKGEVWLGLNSEDGPALVRHLTARPLDGHKLAAVDTTSLRVLKSLPDGGLQRAAARRGLYLGSAVALNPLVSDPQYAQLFLSTEVGTATTENALKPQDLQPLEGVFTFEEADAIVDIAARHNIAVHGHALVYDKASPTWMRNLHYDAKAERQHVREVLEDHVRTVVGHFGDNIISWDVVNEPLNGFNDGVTLEENVWFKALGEDYIAIALRAAHEANPAARLWINDYGLETNPQGRGQYMITLARRLLDSGVPLHGIGIQGHVYQMPRDTIHPEVLRKLTDDFGRLGLRVRVSELDVTGTNGPETQAHQYADVLKACLGAPNCNELTMWGLDDGHGSTAGISNGHLKPGNALLYTPDYRPKYARRLMLDALLK